MSNRRIADSYLNIAFNYLNQDNYDEAIANLNKAIAIEPDNPDLYFERGHAYRRKASFERRNIERNTQGADDLNQSNVDFTEAIRLYEQQQD